MIYTSSITSASLRLRESRIVADLLLQDLDSDQWKQALYTQNSLQMNSMKSIKSISGILKARLTTMSAPLWKIVRDGTTHQATQATLAAAIKHNQLLGDFMDITIREQRALFAKHIEPRLWLDYIAGCRGRDPDMPHWSDSTITKLRSAVFSMLAEAGYFNDTRSLIMQNVFVDTELASYLTDRGETYVLRCMEVTE
jgi:hypothetical protein